MWVWPIIIIVHGLVCNNEVPFLYQYTYMVCCLATVRLPSYGLVISRKLLDFHDPLQTHTHTHTLYTEKHDLGVGVRETGKNNTYTVPTS